MKNPNLYNMIAELAYRRLQGDDQLLRNLNNELDHHVDNADMVILDMLIDPILDINYIKEHELNQVLNDLTRMIHVGFRCGELETVDN